MTRIKQTAKLIVDYSTGVKKGDKVMISAPPAASKLALEIYALVLQKGAFPKMRISLPEQAYVFYKNAKPEHLKHFPKLELDEMKQTDVCIFIGAPENTRQLTNIDPKKVATRQKTVEPIQKWRVNNTRWVIFYYPTNALAQDAEMSLEEFEDFVYSATLVDWGKGSDLQNKVKAVVNKGKRVRIVAKNTDITFSIEGRAAVSSDGHFNLPDGEVFTAPVDDSAEGKVAFSFPAMYGGREVDGIKLEFKNGKVVNASAEKNEAILHEMLAVDDGAKRLGEFGIGLNYNIKKFVKQILFDEKIGGTIHLALGSAYKECKGINKSAVHWDIILDLRNGGELYIDDKLIQKNGKFLL